MGIVIGVAAVLVVLLLVGRRAVSAGADPTQLTFDPSVMEQVKGLALSNQKLPAIRLLREANPTLSMVAAKAIVDRMAGAATHAPGPADHAPSLGQLDLEVELEARNLKAQGQVISAIKLVREHTGWALKESKDYVDGL